MQLKERLAIPRQKVPELEVVKRIINFDEVCQGYDEETAIKEANRCLQCKKPTCRLGCPINNNIPRFIKYLRNRRYEEGYWCIRETSSLPSVCSRVCPHEFQCEGACIRAKKGEAVAIGLLERFLVDWMVLHNKNLAVPCALPKNKKVAIIGSGPAGMTAAYNLAHDGYNCTIYESLPVYGGMLTVGIPPYRLPRKIINAEFESLKNCSVTVVTDFTVGKDLSLDELKSRKGFDAVFLSVGAHKSRKLLIEGEDLNGVIHGVDYLRRVCLGEKVDLGSKVVVVGGGNVAIDVARTALRTGSRDVFILYRRTRKEMPAAAAEIHHLEEEGIHIEFLASPIKILGENGRVKSIVCQKMTLGDCDASGRCRPIVLPDANFEIEADAIIPAISQFVDHTADSNLHIERSGKGTYVVDPETLQTSIPWIFSGGDSVLGPQTAAKAVYQGKVAAESIKLFLEGKNLKENRKVRILT